MRYWGVTKLRYDVATLPNLVKAEDLFNQELEIFSEGPKGALKQWKQLGPLSIQEVID